MREVETDNPVIWPSWCYNTGENRIETEPLKRAITKSPPVNKAKKKRRPISSPASEKRMNGLSSLGVENRTSTPSAFTNAGAVTTASSITSTIATPVKMEVKTERLSPASGMTDNNSSGSNTPSSSYPETPPGVGNSGDRIPSPSLSPAGQLSHPKMTEQPMARNYSDMIRSLAAKYNNANPNDYFSSPKNGLSFGDPRFSSFKSNSSSPFAGLVSPLRSGNSSPPTMLNSSCHLPMTAANTKDSNETDLKHILNATEAQNSLFTFGLNSFGSPAVPGVNLPLFPPLVDMNSTQALLNMVRANSGGVNQLENFIKTASGKRASDSNPLDLSSNVPPGKKPKRPSCSSSESFSSDTSATQQRTKEQRAPIKRGGSESPKPRAKSMFPVPGAQQQAHHDPRSGVNCLSICTSSLDQACTSREGVENVSSWSIDDVHNFVSSIDVCAEYADNFREQSVDGISLPLLTEEHLRTTMNMKLGPALKFRALLAQKIGHCTVCMHCLHCHGGGTGANGHSSLTPIPSNSPSSNATNVRPNSTGH